MRKACLLLVLAGGVGRAQVTTGTILGTVRDNTLAAVSGAVVTITETTKGTSLQFKSDETGSYQAPFLIPGTYSVAAEKEGFKKSVQSGLTLDVDQKARVDLVLEVGAVSETVNVIASSPLVQSDSSELGGVIGERAIRELPLNGRNFAQLVYLTPGVTPGFAGEALSGQSALNPRASSNYNALGHQSIANGWLVDGIDNNEYTFNTVIVSPTVESVREFKVMTGSFSAEFGRGAGVISVSTKSGSNQLHGNVFEFLRNTRLDARNYFSAPTDPKPIYRRNQFGIATGGPIVIPKLYDGHGRTFFFMDYGGIREARGMPFINTVPDARTRIGDFSNFRDTSGALLRIYDPLTTRKNPNFDAARPVNAQNPQFLRDQFAGNIIPASKINPVGLSVASIYPLPNAPGNFNNYTSVVNRTVQDDTGTVRIDHQVSSRNTLFFRFNYDAYGLLAPQGQASCCLPTPADAAKRFDLGAYVAGVQVTELATQGAAFSDTHTIRPNLLNEFRTGYSRTNPHTIQSDYGHNAAESLGIKGINISQFTSGIPNINVADFTGLSGGPNFIPVNNKQTNLQADDSVFWTHGVHTLKFGYHYVRRLMQPFVNIDTRSTLGFTRTFTNDPVTNTQGTGLATLLTGYLATGVRGFLKEPYYITTQEHAGFVQDDIKASRRLTLNLGLRWDGFVPEQEIRDRLVNYDGAAFKLVYAGQDGTSRRANKKTPLNNFAPRIGFAWDFLGDGKTVLRGGFGISYFPEPVTANGQLGLQVPYVISQSFSSDTNPTDFSTVASINNPFPPIVTVTPKTTAELNATNPQVIGQAFENQTPYAETWTLNVQRQLNSSLVWETDYAGSRGIHLRIARNINELQPGTGSQPSRRLIQPLSNVISINQYDPRNMSTYHSLQTKIEKRYSDGLQFLFAYTFSKALDFGAPAASGGGNTGSAQTITNLRAGRGPAGFDVKHRAVASFVWDLPGQSVRGLAGKVIGGWQISGITTLTTGRPYNVTLNTGVNNGATSWPDSIGSGNLADPDPYYYFNAKDFVAPPPNTYGNVGRGILYSPGDVNFDTSFVKNTKVNERWSVQFRFEAYNLFNTPYFGYPNASIGSPTVGRITSTVGDNRSLQVALKILF